ncbi:unnamed protein product [Brassica oleracea var. botrytis]
MITRISIGSRRSLEPRLMQTKCTKGDYSSGGSWRWPYSPVQKASTNE